MSLPNIHIVGAGLSGLAAGVALARETASLEISEAAPQPGGRCRSFHDHALGITVDNGNHLVLGANRATQAYLETVGGCLLPLAPAIRFVDTRTGQRWTVEPGGGWRSRLCPSPRGVPGMTLMEQLRLIAFLRPNTGERLGNIFRCEGALWQRLLGPFLLAALNTEPVGASAELAGIVFRQTLAKGAAACRPLVAENGLSATFVDPALAFLANRDAVVRCNRRLRRLLFGGGLVAALDFGNGVVPVGPDDTVILAVPPWTAGELVPELTVPDDFRPIVNAHFRVSSPAMQPAMIGVVGGTAEWIFAFPDRVSVTVSSAERLVDFDREKLAVLLWRDVAIALELPAALPPWSVIVEKRATFAATPEQVAKRPDSATRWANLFLAGDWIDTGLPATIEGAIRSGRRAADLVSHRLASIGRKQSYAEGLVSRVAHG